MENTVPTAEEFFKGIDKHEDYLNIAIAFAKYHVHAALKMASENAETEEYIIPGVFYVNKDSILDAYPLENIK
jgi:hypothetical protein